MRLPPLSRDDVRAELCRRSLYDFLKQGWHVIEPTARFEDNWHIKSIADHVQATLDDWLRCRDDLTHAVRIQNLIVNCPPGSLKSRILVYACAWMWLQCPSWRVICISANPRNVLRDADFARDLIRSDWYRRTFAPKWDLSEEQAARTRFATTAGGGRIAVGWDAQSAGMRGDAIWVDDPHDPDDVSSEQLANVLERWKIAWSNRVNDLRSSTRVVIMQRVHPDDLAGHLLQDPQWERLVLPTEYDPERAKKTAIGWSDPRTVEGECIHPTRLTPKVIAEEKRKGSFYFASQHQQAPVMLEGGMLKVENLRFWKRDGAPDRQPRSQGCWDGAAQIIPPKFDSVIVAVDCNFKEAATSDYSVVTVWGAKGADRYLIDMRRGQWSFKQLVVEFATACAKHPEAHKKVIEAAANGHALINLLQREISGIVPQKPVGSKEARASALGAAMESGNVFVPDGAPWLGDLCIEFSGFPGRSRHDDIVDSCAWGIIVLHKNHNPYAALTPDVVRRAMSRLG